MDVVGIPTVEDLFLDTGGQQLLKEAGRKFRLKEQTRVQAVELIEIYRKVSFSWVNFRPSLHFVRFEFNLTSV